MTGRLPAKTLLQVLRMRESTPLQHTNVSRLPNPVWLKHHQVFGDQHLAGKMFLHFLGPWCVIVSTDPLSQVRQHDGLDVCALSHFPNNVQSHVTLRGLSHTAGLLGWGHGLPATVVDHRLLPIFARTSFGHQQIRACRKFSDGIAGAGISRKDDHAIRGFKTIGIRLVLAGSRAFMESKMAVFGGRHLDVRVVVNHPGANVMTEEQPGYRYGATAVSNPDLGTYGEILYSGPDQLFSPGRAIDVDRFRALAIPRQGHQRTKSSCVIIMMVCNKNRSDLSDINTGLRKTPCDGIAGIDDIMRSIDG